VVFDFPTVADLSEHVHSELVARSDGGGAHSPKTNWQPGRREVSENLKAVVHSLLGADSGTTIDVHAPLADMGLDSLGSAELARILSNQFAVQLPSTVMFDYPTIAELSEHVHGELVAQGGELVARGDDSMAPVMKMSPESEQVKVLEEQVKVLEEKVKVLEEQLAGTQKAAEGEYHVREYTPDPFLGVPAGQRATPNQGVGFADCQHEIPLPASFEQEQTIADQVLNPTSTAYNVPLCLIGGGLDVAVFEQCLQMVFERHDIFRTCFVVPQPGVDREEQSCITQMVHPPNDVTAPVEMQQVSSIEDVHEIMRNQMRAPFDLGTAPLLRVSLCPVSDSPTVGVCIVMHQAITDDHSIGMFLEELRVCYHAVRRGDAPFTHRPAQYAGHALWQQCMLCKPATSAALQEYWKDALPIHPNLSLPHDHPPQGVLVGSCDRVHFSIDAALITAVQQMCVQSRCSLFDGLIAAYGILLCKMGVECEEGVVVGVAFANRSTQAGSDKIQGPFANVLPVLVRAGGCLGPLLEAVKDAVQAARGQEGEHTQLPCTKIADLLGVDSSCFAQAVLRLQKDVESSVKFDDSELERQHVVNPFAKYQLLMDLHQSMSGGIEGTLEFMTELFTRDTAMRVANRFIVMLQSISSVEQSCDLRELQWIPAQEETEIIALSKEAPHSKILKSNTLVDIFERAVQNVPHSVAVVTNKERLSYVELHNRTNVLAKDLQLEFGVQPHDLLGLCVDRDAAMIVGMLAILKLGGAYVPLDPDMPLQRAKEIIEDSGIVACIRQEGMGMGWAVVVTVPQVVILANGRKTETLTTLTGSEQWPVVAPNDLCYLLYTSGSTGKPKGVLVEHAGLVHALENATRIYQVKADDRSLTISSFTFDMAAFSIWSSFAMWGSVALPPLSEILGDLTSTVARYGCSWFLGTPSMMATQLRNLGQLREAGLKFVALGGEALPPSMIKIVAHSVRLVNGYGPTEASAQVNACECHPEMRFPGSLGRPHHGLRSYVMDRHKGLLLPVGVPGEYVVSGVQLARGYHNRPEQTNQSFVRNPYLDRADTDEVNQQFATMYRTGDLCRWLPDGSVEYLGRIDQQVKLRGYRIELGEISNRLLEVDGIEDAVAVVLDGKLVAYVVTQPGASVGRCMAHLDQTLPKYMVPSVVMPLASFPKTVSGKVDTKALPAPASSLETSRKEVDTKAVSDPAREEVICDSDTSRGTSRGSCPPYLTVRAQVMSVLAEFGVAEVEGSQHWADTGLDSLKMIHIANQLADIFGEAVPLRPTLMFDHPTLDALVGHIERMLLPEKVSGHVRETLVLNQGNNRAAASELLAIIGLSCRFPGGMESPQAFWDLVSTGGRVVSQAVPFKRWDMPALLAASPSSAQNRGVPPFSSAWSGDIRAKASWGCFVDDFNKFDPGFFRLSHAEAEQMEPQHRVLLECSHLALRDAFPDYSLDLHELRGSRTGVFGALYREPAADSSHMHGLTTPMCSSSGPGNGGAYVTTGRVVSVAVGRVSFLFDLHGPAMVYDTTCSSSLAALHGAAAALRRGECEVALVAGVNQLLDPLLFLEFASSNVLSATGGCHSFDARADGYLRSEGCGAVVLKRVSKGSNTKPDMYALLESVRVAHDGSSVSLTAPNGSMQQCLIGDALRDAGITPSAINYVEAHGTGTPLGDPIEIASLATIFSAECTADAATDGEASETGAKRISKSAGSGLPVHVGCVKANLGHLECASGMAGLIKAVLVLQHKQAPPNAALQKLNPLIAETMAKHQPVGKGPVLHFPRELEPLRGPKSCKQDHSSEERKGHERKSCFAGVSSFGLSGTIAHAVLSSAPDTCQRDPCNNNNGGDSSHSLDNAFPKRREFPWQTGGFLPHPLLQFAAPIGARGMEFRTIFHKALIQSLYRVFFGHDIDVSSSVARFPAAGLLEMALSAALRAGRSGPAIGVQLEGIEFPWPLVLMEGTEVVCEHHFAHGGMDFYTRERGEGNLICAVKKTKLSPHRNLIDEVGVNISVLDYWKRECDMEVFHGACQERMDSMPPTLESDQPSIWMNRARSAALARFSVGGVKMSTTGGGYDEYAPFYVVHPGILHAALRLVSVCLGTEDNSVAQVTGIERVVLHQPLRVRQEVWAHVRRNNSECGGSFTVHVCDVEGRIVIENQGVQVVKTAPLPLGVKHQEAGFFAACWIEAPPLVSTSAAVVEPIGLVELPGCAHLVDFGSALRMSPSDLLLVAAGFGPQQIPRKLVVPLLSGHTATSFMTSALTEDVLMLLQVLNRLSSQRELQVAFLTSGVQGPSVGSHAWGNNDAAAAEAMLLAAPIWGLMRGARQELLLSKLSITMIDADSDDLCRSAVSELASGDLMPEVAYRGGRRFFRKLRWAKPILLGNTCFANANRADVGTALITGGLGGLGLLMADVLVAAGCKRVVLVSRSGRVKSYEGQDLHGRLQRLQAAADALNCEVSVQSCDVGCEEDLRALLQRERRLGKLDVIVHAAGVLANARLKDQNTDRVQAVFNAKAKAAWFVHQQTLEDDLKSFVLFSSVAALMGHVGMANYCASNAFLDALACYRRTLKLPAVSIQWPAIADVGMAAAMDSEWRPHPDTILERQLAQAVFGQVWRSSSTPPMDMPVLSPIPVGFFSDTNPLLQAPFARALVEHVMPFQRQAAQQVEGDGTRGSSRGQGEQQQTVIKQQEREVGEHFHQPEPHAAASKWSLRAVFSEVAVAVQSVLGADGPGVGPDANILEADLDSLALGQLVHNMRTRFDLEISPMAIFTYPTVKELGQHIYERLYATCSVATPASSDKTHEGIIEQHKGDVSEREHGAGSQANADKPSLRATDAECVEGAPQAATSSVTTTKPGPVVPTKSIWVDGSMVTASRGSNRIEGVLVCYQEGRKSRMPIVDMHSMLGVGLGLMIRKFTTDPEQPVYSFQAPELCMLEDQEDNLSSKAEQVLSEIGESLQSRIKYYYGVYQRHIGSVGAHLVGYSSGGILARELAFQLQQDGLPTTLTLVDPPFPLPAFGSVAMPLVERLLRVLRIVQKTSLPPKEIRSEIKALEVRFWGKLRVDSLTVSELRTELDTLDPKLYSLLDLAVRNCDWEAQTRQTLPAPKGTATIFLLDGRWQKEQWAEFYSDQIEKLPDGTPWSREELYGWRRLIRDLEVKEAQGYHPFFYTKKDNTDKLASHLLGLCMRALNPPIPQPPAGLEEEQFVSKVMTLGSGCNKSPSPAQQDAGAVSHMSFDMDRDLSHFRNPIESTLCCLRKGDPGKMPIVLVHGLFGQFYGTQILQVLDRTRPVYCFQAVEWVNGDIFDSSQARMQHYCAVYRRHFGNIGAHLVGWSAGAFYVREMAFLFKEVGLVFSLTLIDPPITMLRHLPELLRDGTFKWELQFLEELGRALDGDASKLLDPLLRQLRSGSIQDSATFRRELNAIHPKMSRLVAITRNLLMSLKDVSSELLCTDRPVRMFVAENSEYQFHLWDWLQDRHGGEELDQSTCSQSRAWGWFDLIQQLHTAEVRGAHHLFWLYAENVQALGSHLEREIDFFEGK
jgi:amino acid adenylation domain-containing protein